MYVVNNQYATPKDYAIPNPLGPRVHNWRGGPLNEGSLYHGPVYTRPSYRMPWMMRPLQGVGQTVIEVGLTNAAFVGIVALLYPDLRERLVAEGERRSGEEGTKPTERRLFDCIKKEFPEVPSAPPEAPDAEDALREKFPRSSVEKVLNCFEGKLSNMAVVLPVVAGGALILWLFARKR